MSFNKTPKKMISSFIFLFLFLFTASTFIASAHVSDREILWLACKCYYNLPDHEFSTEEKKKIFDKKRFGLLSNPDEYSDFKVVDYVINKKNKDMSGFSVITYVRGDDIIIAFRGTDDGVVGENWQCLLPKSEHPQLKYVAPYIDRLQFLGIIKENTKIYITGHSLGGLLATYATGVILKSESLRKNFVKTITFNGLGFLYSIKDKKIEEELRNLQDDKLVHYRIEKDAVSLLGEHFTTPITFSISPFYFNENKFGFLENPHLTSHFFYYEPFLKKYNLPKKKHKKFVKIEIPNFPDYDLFCSDMDSIN